MRKAVGYFLRESARQWLTAAASSVFSWVFLALFPMLIIRDIARGGEPAWPFYATSALSFV
jgi:hypothetical protein